MRACAVRHCQYIAETAIEDFVVCALHDSSHVRRMLESMQAPAAYWMDDRPIVLPCDELSERDFEPQPVIEGAMRALDDPRLASVPGTPSVSIHPHFDLTRER